jgi:hypothetical protein
VKKSTTRHSGDKKSDVKNSAIKKSDVKNSDVKNSAIKNSDVKKSDVKKSDVKKSDVKKSDVKNSDVKKSSLYSSDKKILSHQSVNESFDSIESDKSSDLEDLNDLSESNSESNSGSNSGSNSESNLGSESISESNSESELIAEIDFTKMKSKDLTNEHIVKINQRIKDIVELKNKYVNKPNGISKEKILTDLENEKKQLILLVYEFKKNNDKQIKKNKEKVENIKNEICEIKPDADNDCIGLLDLEIDPTNDHNDLKNILIKLNSDQKISDISLISYYLPFNENNVTRFNGEFAIFLQERTYRTIIPSGLYTIHTLIKYITNQFNFLEFSIDENNIITIKNNINVKFDLMTGDSTIFPLLGFTSKSNSYRNKLSFTGSSKFDTESNKKVFFVLSGTSMDPIELEFDSKVEKETPLKKSKAGFNMKQIILRFTNSLNQCYDFIMPLKMYLRITYVKNETS